MCNCQGILSILFITLVFTSVFTEQNVNEMNTNKHVNMVSEFLVETPVPLPICVPLYQILHPREGFIHVVSKWVLLRIRALLGINLVSFQWKCHHRM